MTDAHTAEQRVRRWVVPGPPGQPRITITVVEADEYDILLQRVAELEKDNETLRAATEDRVQFDVNGAVKRVDVPPPASQLQGELSDLLNKLRSAAPTRVTTAFAAAVIERQQLANDLLKAQMDAMEDCIGVEEGQSFEERAEALIVTEVNHETLRATTPPASPPIAYIHEITEPGGGVNRMYSASNQNPWSHWVANHMDRCKYTRTSLYTRPSDETNEPPCNPSGG